MIGEFCPKVFALNVVGRARGGKRRREVDADASGMDRQRFSVASFIHS